MKTRRGVAGTVGLVAVLLLVGASVWIGPQLRSPQQAAAEAAPPDADPVTIGAERRTLTEPLTLRGQVRPGPSEKLTVPESWIGPNAVVTRVHLRRDSRLREGQPVIEIAGKPVFALKLPFPLYRDVAGGDSGRDVQEVQRALRRMGYRLAVTGTLDEPSQRALKQWFAKSGYAVPHGDDAPMMAAEQRLVEAKERAADDTGSAAAQSAVTNARRELALAKLAAGPVLRQTSVLRLVKDGQEVTRVVTKLGAVIDAPERATIAEMNGGPPRIAVSVSREQVSLLSVDQRATILDEASGAEAEALVESIGTEFTEDGQGMSGFPVSLRFVGDPIDASDRAVRIDLRTSKSSRPVLAVPVTAIYSQPDGTVFVSVLADGQVRDVAVRTGQIAGGWTEIIPTPPAAVIEGTRVVVGRDAVG